MRAMGVMFDYFAAATDDHAATVIDRIGGPGAAPPAVRPQKARRTIFGRKSAAAPPATADMEPWIEYDTVSVKGSLARSRSCSLDAPSTTCLPTHAQGTPSRLETTATLLSSHSTPRFRQP